MRTIILLLLLMIPVVAQEPEVAAPIYKTLVLTPGRDDDRNGRDDDWRSATNVQAKLFDVGIDTWLTPDCDRVCPANGYAFTRDFELPITEFIDLTDITIEFSLAYNPGITFADCYVNGNYLARVFNATTKSFVFSGAKQQFYRYGTNQLVVVLNNPIANGQVAMKLDYLRLTYHQILDRSEGRIVRPRLRDVKPRG